MSDDALNEELELAQSADPAAKARAAKAAKAAAKAAADVAKAEEQKKSASAGQPVVSTLKTRAVVANEGEPVEMRVTYKGHGQISTGGEFGFERYGRNAIITVGEFSARSLYEKGWAEPADERYVDRWETAKRRETIAEAAAYRRFQDVLEHGVGAGQDYNSHATFGGQAPL